jgi:prepilin-type N-terminal cleavage/methylation domain-containing protein
MNKKKRQRGLTLLEILLVMAILGILAAAGIGIFYGSVRSQELGITSDMIVSDLRLARSKAMTGEDRRNWGVHFVNDESDYYELFSSPGDYDDASKSVNATIYLSGAVSFTAPAASSSAVFSKIIGTLGATETITIISSANESRTVTVTPLGNIY